MNIRKKGNDLRISLLENGPHSQPYVSIKVTACWGGTWINWGKNVETPLIEMGGRVYKIVLEEVK